jgi:hypothetical protein
MKKIILFFLLILISIGLSAVTFDLSLAMRTPKIDSLAIDYEIGLRCTIDSLLSAEIEIERDTGEYYHNTELFVWQYWKFLQFSGKYIDIQEDDLKVISADIRIKHKTHSLGIAEVWDLHPEINLVVGEDIKWTFGIPYLCPIEFRAVTNFFTNDFKKYNNTTEIQFNGSISSIVSIYFRLKERYYDKFNFSAKIGIGIKL